MPWQTKYFEGDEVLVRTDPDGEPYVEDDRAEMKYSDEPDAPLYHPSVDRLYDDRRASLRAWVDELDRREQQLDEREEKLDARASELDRREQQLDEWQEQLTSRALETGEGTNGGPSNMNKEATDVPGELRSHSDVRPRELTGIDPPDRGIVEVHTDGACAGNPGPCGYGLVARGRDEYLEVSAYLGEGTNNVAELNGIRAAVELFGDRSEALEIYTDSRYCIGVLTEDWNVNANRDLVFTIRDLLDEADGVELRKVEGHAGEPLNERADALAKQALP
ncbi:MAG: RNase H family protein [Bradymonadaceae bacterium]